MTIDESVENTTTSASNDPVEKSTVDPATDPTTEVLKPKTTSKASKRLAEKSIEHGTEIDSKLIPQSKYISFTLQFSDLHFFFTKITNHSFYCRNTFPLKIAPWIRVNGSVNRRVLDKYAGTILLYCIENAGLTLFTLCTRFHYLLPIHVYEIIQVCNESCSEFEQFENGLKIYFICSIWKNSDA